MTRDITQLPYADRQLVIVLPDDVVAASNEAEIDAKQSDEPTDWYRVVDRTLREISRFSVFSLLVREALHALAQAKENGLNVLNISRSESALLTFPPGHPTYGVLYVGHPALPSVYYPIASFHRMVFQHKFAEAIDLLMALGATELRVESERGWSGAFASKLSTSLPSVAQASAEAGHKSGAKTSLLFEAELEGSSDPALPDSLVWYRHEPIWQSTAKGRLHHRLKTFSISVIYEDDFGVNAELKASANDAGLELGGQFEDHKATTWNISGRFADT